MLLIYAMKGKVKTSIKPSKLDPEMRKKLGARIRQLRLEKNESYEDFANEHGIARAQFGRYENGEDMRVSSLLRVVNAFGITLEKFFSEGF
jgi:transcriptional regulator with XRE-family HTH domain